MPGLGEVPWNRFIAGLIAVGYNGVVSVEHEDRAFEGDLGNIALRLDGLDTALEGRVIRVRDAGFDCGIEPAQPAFSVGAFRAERGHPA